MHHALETIAHQHNDTFPEKLDALIAQIYKAVDGKNLKEGHPLGLKLQSIIFERFGMRVVYFPALTFFSAAAIIPFFRDHESEGSALQGVSDIVEGVKPGGVFNKLKAVLKDRDKTMRLIDKRTGFINTKLAKVGGYMSDVSHYLIIDFSVFKQMNITERELSAIILHEIGHAFDGMEEHYRLTTTNRAISDVLMELSDNNPDKALYKYRHTFTEAELETAQLSSAKDRQDFCGKLAMQFLGNAKSQLIRSKYDETNFENMADTFATRFGRGQELASALAKLHSVRIDDNNNALRVILTTLEILGLASLLLIFPIYGFVTYMVVMSYVFRISDKQMTYDTFYDRLQRMKNTIVGSLKDQRLPVEMVRDALAQIDFIEKMSEAGREYKSLLSDFGDLLYSDARADTKHIDLQKSIEHHLNNRLFVQAARVRAGI